jgi:DNA topoisomerase IA
VIFTGRVKLRGHIADLPSKEIGVDVENGFKPKYEVSTDKKHWLLN